MSAKDSDLSSQKYGYDLVCATTQAGINASMKRFLSGFSGKEISVCYTYDVNAKKPVETPLATITNKLGGADLFAIPNGTGGNDSHVNTLYNECKFLFGFRAKLGVPSGLAPRAVPDVVVLNKGNSLVTFQLFCAEFEVVNLENNFGNITFSNISQPDTAPWLFVFNVNLDMRTGDQNAFDKLPPSVQQQVKNINPNSMFSVQQLYLDLTTAGLESLPAIQGLDPTSDAFIYLTKAFVNSYWRTLNANGQGCLLGYAIKPTSPNTQVSSIVPTDLNIEVSPHLDKNGIPTSDFGVYTLNYLVMSKGAQMPAPTAFGWNWVETNEKGDFHGVIAIRNNIFLDFLSALVNPQLQPLNIVSTVEMHHDGETYNVISYRLTQSSTPISFTPVQSPNPDADGYTRVSTVSISRPCYDDSMTTSHSSSINGNYDYALAGDVAFKDNDIRIKLHVTLYVEFNIHEMGIKYNKCSQNGIDYQIEAHYQLTVTPQGQLTVVATTNDKDNASPLSWSGGGIVDTSDVRDYVRAQIDRMKPVIEGAMKNFEGNIKDMLNHSHAWVFPGGQTFLYKMASFSKSLDLITYITYADPS